MKSKFSLILTILFALVIVQMTFAAEGESAAAKPTKDELGMWWNKSSLTYSPMVTNYLVPPCDANDCAFSGPPR